MGLRDGQSYTVHVTLTDAQGNVLNPPVSTNVSFSVGQSQPTQTPTFQLSALKPELNAKPNAFATYLIKLEGKHGFDSTINLFGSGLSMLTPEN